MKVGDPVEFLREPEGKGPLYNHPMDAILREIQGRRHRPNANIKLSHVFICLAVIMLYVLRVLV
jgi:hypothetical protein